VTSGWFPERSILAPWEPKKGRNDPFRAIDGKTRNVDIEIFVCFFLVFTLPFRCNSLRRSTPAGQKCTFYFLEQKMHKTKAEEVNSSSGAKLNGKVRNGCRVCCLHIKLMLATFTPQYKLQNICSIHSWEVFNQNGKKIWSSELALILNFSNVTATVFFLEQLNIFLTLWL